MRPGAIQWTTIIRRLLCRMKNSSDLLPPCTPLSHSVRIQLLRDSQIALDLVIEDAKTNNQYMSKEFSIPHYSPWGYLAPPPDYVPFSPEDYINDTPIQLSLPACRCLPHPPFGLLYSMTSMESQGGLHDDWTPPSLLSYNLGVFVASAGLYPSRIPSPPNRPFDRGWRRGMSVEKQLRNRKMVCDVYEISAFVSRMNYVHYPFLEGK